MKALKKFIKPSLLPFLVLVLLSIVLIISAYYVKNSFIQNILSNMAATSIYALIAIFTYDWVKRFADREKTKELRDYAQGEVNPQILAIMISISRVVYPKNNYPKISELGKNLDQLTKTKISNELKNREYLGFEILQNSKETTKNVRSLLENSFIRPLLDDELVLVLLKITNRLETLFGKLADERNLVKVQKPIAEEYIIFGSKEIASYNAHYPNRRLLLKKIPKKQGMGVVERFADFSPEISNEMLLSYYKIKEDSIGTIAETLSEILNLIKKWIKQN